MYSFIFNYLFLFILVSYLNLLLLVLYIYFLFFIQMIKSITFRIVQVIYECIDILTLDVLLHETVIVNTTERSFTSDSGV